MPRAPRKAKPSAKRPRKGASQEAQLHAALAGLAHEVRTPLNGILVLADLLAVSDLPPRERKWAASLRGAAEHLARLTTLVVDGVRAGRGALVPKSQPFDLRALASDLAEGLATRAAAKGLDVETAPPEGLPHMVVGDRVLLRAALENLLDNAVKFTEHGRVALAVAAAPEGERALRLTFTVTDSGVGMTEAELRRLFRPFAQANKGVAGRFGGAGLGLAFARQVARALGGDLTATSTPGAGSRFRLDAIVQAADQEGARPARSGVAAGAAPGRRLHILCAEDNPYGRVMFNTMATALGHRITFVTSGSEAVEAMRGSRYDLVLMDVVLPGMDGIEATRRIRALAGETAATPIIGISGRGDAAEEAAARAAGMTEYLVKPVGPAALTAAIAAVARG